MSAADAGHLAENRRLVTVLFADLSGSTALAERLDPEELRGILGSFFGALAHQIQRFEGTVDKYIGDAVMAVFGAPMAHEDDPERAIRAALAMQTAIVRLNDDLERQHGVRLALRIGINTGEVVAGLLAGQVQSAYTVVGETVNLAQRFESAAQPGEILIGPTTYRLARRAFEFNPLSPISVKGKADPIPVYRVIAERQEREIVPEPTGLVAREAELALLRDALGAAMVGQGRVVSIVGEAGVGKSRLAKEFVFNLPGRIERLVARCTSFETNTPYALIAGLLRSVFGINPGNNEATSWAAMLRGFDALGTPPPEPQLIVLLDVLGFGERSALDPESKRRILVHLLRHVLTGRSQRAPLVIVLEDLHWIDPASAAVLGDLVAAVPKLSCLALATGRPDWEPSWPSLRVDLKPLSEPEARALVERCLGGAAEPSLMDAVLARTAGNPFFTEELVRSLKESGAIAETDGLWRVQGPVDLTVPETVQEVLSARLDRVGTGPRRSLQAAAVIGRSFGYRVLQRVSGHPTLAADLDILEKKGFVERRTARPEQIYAFRHALIQDVAYHSLLRAQRRVLHGTVGAAIETLYANRADEFVRELAFHYGQSDNDERAVHWLTRAGNRAKSLFANEEALTLYRGALERVRDAEGSAEASSILEHIGDVQTVVGMYDAALESFHTARERVSPEPAHVARLYRKAGAALTRKGAYSEAHAALAEGIAALGGEIDVEAAQLGVRMGEVYSRSGNYAAAKEALARAVEIAERVGADRVVAEGLRYLAATVAELGDLQAAATLYQRCLRIHERLGDIPGTAAAHNGIGIVYERLGRWDDALDEYGAALSLDERIGDPWTAAMCHNNMGEVYLARGDFERAILSKQRALEVWTALGAESQATLALMGLGHARVRSGDVARGREDLLEAERRIRAQGQTRFLPDLYRHLAYAGLRAGDLDAARRAAERSLECARAARASRQEAITQRVLGEIALRRGDLVHARALLESSRDRLAELGEIAELHNTEAVLANLAESPAWPAQPR